MNLEEKKDKLRHEWAILRNGAWSCGVHSQSVKLREKEEKVYKKWNFYDNFIKASEKGK